MTPTAVPDWFGQGVGAADITGHWVTHGTLETVPAVAGAYVLAVRVDHATTVDLPGRKQQHLCPGWHIYLGSARGPGGLRARIGRHFRRGKAVHWHIDRLTCAPVEIAALAVPEGDECDLVARLLASGRFQIAASGFGNTDCRRCDSHLLSRRPC